MITDDYGTQCWYINDQLHRTDGPALIFPIDILIKNDVNQLMTELDISYPFDEEQQSLFLLTFSS